MRICGLKAYFDSSKDDLAVGILSEAIGFVGEL